MPDEYVDEEFEAAEECLNDAKIMLETEVSDRTVASRLYYACYHAAKAALYSKGFEPSGHGGIVSLFGKEIMDGEKITREDAKFLSRSQTRREQADYEQQPVEENLQELTERTEKFVRKMKEVVESEEH